MPLYEVEVRGQIKEFYEIEARDEDDAREKWSNGVLVGEDTWDYGVENIVLQFEDDDLPTYDIDFEEEDEPDEY